MNKKILENGTVFTSDKGNPNELAKKIDEDFKLNPKINKTIIKKENTEKLTSDNIARNLAHNRNRIKCIDKLY